MMCFSKETNKGILEIKNFTKNIFKRLRALKGMLTLRGISNNTSNRSKVISLYLCILNGVQTYIKKNMNSLYCSVENMSSY